MQVNTARLGMPATIAFNAAQRVRAMTDAELTSTAQRLGLDAKLGRASLEKIIAARIGLAGAVVPRVMG